MEILKRRFFKKRKQPMQVMHKKFIATAVGYVPWGDGAAEYFYNLYEYEDGTRECEKFDGGQYYIIPENADFSTKAQVKAWVYGGAIPTSVLSYEALIDSANKKIERHGQDTLICEITDDGEIGYPLSCDEMDRELEKALDIQLSRYKKRK